MARHVYPHRREMLHTTLSLRSCTAVTINSHTLCECATRRGPAWPGEWGLAWGEAGEAVRWPVQTCETISTYLLQYQDEKSIGDNMHLLFGCGITVSITIYFRARRAGGRLAHD